MSCVNKCLYIYFRVIYLAKMSPLRSSDIQVKIGEAVFYEVEDLDGAFSQKVAQRNLCNGKSTFIKKRG